nr:helix-turn-helix domain-containing protein [[Phormidium] sp. ETS-05]
MSSRKLSDSDKYDILQLYRQPGETTLTLASRYGVSSSTISRILKSTLSDSEYETLIQEKRAGRFQTNDPSEFPAAEVSVTPETVRPRLGATATSEPIRRRTRSTSGSSEADTDTRFFTQLNLLDVSDPDDDSDDEKLEALYRQDDDVSPLNKSLEEDLLEDDDLDDEEDLDDLDDEDDLDDDDDGDDDDDDVAFDAELLWGKTPPGRKTILQVQPLSSADLPKPCYLVVDRSGELITRPLKDFGELGRIPAGEFQERTLPVFDNHRVARRFSNRHQRVIKVPDGSLLQKLAAYLEAKGITRLLVDGQVYAI